MVNNPAKSHMIVVKIDIFRNLDQMKASRQILVYLFIFSTTKIQINKTRKADKVPRPVSYRTNDHLQAYPEMKE